MRPAHVVVQERLEAYNRHDMDAFVATYHPDIKIHRLPAGELLVDGHGALREVYRTRFEEGSQVRVALTQRIVEGAFVVDAEVISGLMPDRELSVTVIYEVRDGLIVHSWVVRDWPEGLAAGPASASGGD